MNLDSLWEFIRWIFACEGTKHGIVIGWAKAFVIVLIVLMLWVVGGR